MRERAGRWRRADGPRYGCAGECLERKKLLARYDPLQLPWIPDRGHVPMLMPRPRDLFVLLPAILLVSAGGNSRACAQAAPASAAHQVKGFGVIERVLETGAQPLFEADGYKYGSRAQRSCNFPEN